MSDSFDPGDAIVEGATDAVKRLVAFLLVSGGAAILGSNLHEAPGHIASIQANGLGSALDFLKDFSILSPALWVLMMFVSIFVWYLLPFMVAYIWLLVRLWRGEDTFNVLLALALIHPLHTFIYLQRMDPLSIGDLILASALLVVCEAGFAGLVLWWRHVREDAPLEPEPPEPEL
jgi:hypothetical protein